MVKIKELRQELGVTQKALADASELDIRWLQKLEAGDIDIQNVTVKRFFLLMKGMCKISRQVPCPQSMNRDFETVRGIQEMLEEFFKEGSA